VSAKVTDPRAQTAFLLARHRIELVLDVGANVGQYARGLRAAGYGGRILSFEPQSAAHAALTTAAAADPAWLVAPRMALGDAEGEVTINLSGASDMSSALAFTAETERHFASDRFVGSETAPLRRLDGLWPELVRPGERVFLKSDTQGFDLAVLRGASGALASILGVQVEASLHPIYQGQPDYRAVLDFLLPAGFALMQVIPGYFSRHHGRMLECDLVLFRSS
jgi:FkbM family methyltransferase